MGTPEPTTTTTTDTAAPAVRGGGGVDPAVWHRADMRTALAGRDFAAVFRLLHREGMSQRRIARWLGMSQSEISEILGGRRVVSYDVLVRIAAAFAIPRGWLGVAYDPDTLPLAGLDPTDESTVVHDGGRDRPTPALPTAVFVTAIRPTVPTLGRSALGLAGTVVAEVVAGTQRLREHAHTVGGGAGHSLVLAHLASSIDAATGCTDPAMFAAMGEIHQVAGWTAADSGLLGAARHHLECAAQYATHATHPAGQAAALHDHADVLLRHGWPVTAQPLVDAALRAADNAGVPELVAVSHAYRGWILAALGDGTAAASDLARVWQLAPPTAAGTARLHHVHAAAVLAAPDPAVTDAVHHLRHAITARPSTHVRDQCQDWAALATAYLRLGKTADADDAIEHACTLATGLSSARVRDALTAVLTLLNTDYAPDPALSDARARLHAAVHGPHG